MVVIIACEPSLQLSPNQTKLSEKSQVSQSINELKLYISGGPPVGFEYDVISTQSSSHGTYNVVLIGFSTYW